jgi:polyphosphate kinase 2 (PPK2 family)
VDLRLPHGPVDLTAIPTDATPGFKGGKKDGKEALAALGPELSDLQERLFAEGSTGSTRNVLLVLQGAINDFEQRLVDGGTRIVKCMLHISAEEQKERLLARLDDPTKHWKFNPKDLDERALWPAYREAYEIALERTNTEHAPWNVIPADRKWFRNLAIGRLLHQALEDLDPQWPKAEFDVDAERTRLEDETPVA